MKRFVFLFLLFVLPCVLAYQNLGDGGIAYRDSWTIGFDLQPKSLVEYDRLIDFVTDKDGLIAYYPFSIRTSQLQPSLGHRCQANTRKSHGPKRNYLCL